MRLLGDGSGPEAVWRPYKSVASPGLSRGRGAFVRGPVYPLAVGRIDYHIPGRAVCRGGADSPFGPAVLEDPTGPKAPPPLAAGLSKRLLPVLALCLLLGYGRYNMGRIVKTEYTVLSDKLSGEYRIVLITDTHYGTIQDPAVLRAAAEEINALAPDIVILGGDIVEEDTSKEAMEEAFRTLGSLKSTYGVYYVYGNHDRQLYTDAPAYTENELAQAVTANGIVILDDRTVNIGRELVLAGREDVGRRQGRLPAQELLKGADRSRFLIVADHQPVGAEENAAQGVDLELSGHTHAGQLLPIGYINILRGMRNYGLSRADGCTVIVSSGVAGWGFPIRTQGRCEYAVITLRPEG